MSKKRTSLNVYAALYRITGQHILPEKKGFSDKMSMEGVIRIKEEYRVKR